MTSQVRSMTGFGAGSAETGTHRVEVTVRSVNHRQLDVRLSCPPSWAGQEAALVALVKSRLHRGRVEVRFGVQRGGDSAPIDLAAASAVGAELRAVAEAAGVVAEPTVADVLSALARRRGETNDVPDEGLVAAATVALNQALERFVEFRAREGASLHRVFTEQLEVVRDVAATIESARLEELSRYRERLRSRVDELLGGDAAVAPERLAAEIVLIAERSDIAEEIQRATAHVDALVAHLEGPGPHGKRLDFLLQELIRETNTMASKSVSSRVTHRVVDAKTAVERMREQALNVE